ncbi:hypothetical protein [uncultured Jatrophihabitans sp.]|uniref:hypothetical protein n=1 Tax=uncultured Jatrophihabitans sp. TaxID=1610747 RepID=UPI0035CBA6DE
MTLAQNINAALSAWIRPDRCASLMSMWTLATRSNKRLPTLTVTGDEADAWAGELLSPLGGQARAPAQSTAVTEMLWSSASLCLVT